MDPRADMGGCGEEKNILSKFGFEPRTVQVVANRCPGPVLSFHDPNTEFWSYRLGLQEA